MKESTVELPTGRQLRVLEDAELRGSPMFVLHGTPGSRLIYEPFTKGARRRGLRLISYDRPGYGGSTSLRGRTVVDSVKDIQAIADELGIDHFAVWGEGGGGSSALACAAVLPGRVVAAASVAGAAPFPAEGLDWFAGMGEYNVRDVQLMMSDQPAWELKCRIDRDEMLAATPVQTADMLSSMNSEVDQAPDMVEFNEYNLRRAQEGLKNGEEGMRDDSLAMVKPWGFDLSDIRLPVQIWHGGQDRYIPSAHGDWLAAHIPHAEAHIEPDEGSGSILLHHVPELHAWLAFQF